MRSILLVSYPLEILLGIPNIWRSSEDGVRNPDGRMSSGEGLRHTSYLEILPAPSGCRVKGLALKVLDGRHVLPPQSVIR